MIPSVGHSSICPQSAQVSDCFSLTQLCTGQNLSQKGVFAPAIRHPVQFIISGVIVTPLSFVHSTAVFSRKALSFVIVAIRASHFSQSSPQQPINWFVYFIVTSANWKIYQWWSITYRPSHLVLRTRGQAASAFGDFRPRELATQTGRNYKLIPLCLHSVHLTVRGARRVGLQPHYCFANLSFNYVLRLQSQTSPSARQCLQYLISFCNSSYKSRYE